MSDHVGNSIFDPALLDSDEDLRKLFVEQMRGFAKTIEDSPTGPMIISMLTPYLAMIGATNLISKLDSNSLVEMLNEAADTAESSEEDSSGVMFGYYTSGQLTIVAFDFLKGTVANMTKPLASETDTLAGELFLGVSIRKEITQAAEELNMSPLWRATSVLCGVDV